MRTASGLFTTEIARAASQLPHRDFSFPVYRTVVAAFHAAWHRLRDALGVAISSCLEKDFTALLVHQMNQIRAEVDHSSGFRADFFQTVVGGAEVVSYDGSSLEKKPDITIRLVSQLPLQQLAEYRALFVECKLVDGKKPISLYGKKGLMRFVEGDYAWAMPSGMMIAYARGSRNVPQTLTPHLEKARRKKKDPYRTYSLPRVDPTLSGGLRPEVYVSAHAREWRYQDSSCAPGRITILHLWLSADEEAPNP